MIRVIRTDKWLLWKVIFLAGSLIGFCIQNSQIWTTYFQYETRSSIMLLPYNTEEPVPNMALCSIFSPTNQTFGELLISKTLGDADDTWGPTKVVLLSSKGVKTIRKEKIEKYFRIRKFVKHNRYCVSVEPTAFGLKYPFMDNVYRMPFSMEPFSTDEYHYGAIYLSPQCISFFGSFDDRVMFIARDPDKGTTGVEITISFTITDRQFLQDPYDTHCLFYNKHTPFRSQAECIEECQLEKTYKRLQRLSMEVIVWRNTRRKWLFNMSRFTLEDLEKDGMYETLKAIKTDCQNLCKRRDCKKQFVSPRTIDKLTIADDGQKSKNITIDLRTPSHYVVYVTSHPISLLPDVLSFTISSLSFWFGVCPMFLITYMRERKSDLKKLLRMTSKDKNIVAGIARYQQLHSHMMFLYSRRRQIE